MDEQQFEQYVNEFQQLIDIKGDEVYPQQDPFAMSYDALASMAVLCARLYVGMRAAEDRVQELLDNE